MTKNTSLNKQHLVDKKRSWFTKPERTSLVLVYHNAYKAGKHVDMHLGNGISLIIRVSGKPVELGIKYNSKGRLTQKTEKLLLKHVQQELSDKARVPQNYDHSRQDAHMDWDKDQGPPKGEHGSGEARQVFHESEVQVMKVGPNTCTFYAPSINADRSMYAHVLNNTNVPILIVGGSKKKVPVFLEKPDLKYIQGKDINKYLKKTDRACDTKKYDGASCHCITDKDGTRVYSPRESVVTGTSAEYTGKIPRVAPITSNETIHWMAEFMAYKNGKALPSEKIAGILNSESLVPKNVRTELRVYRIDKWGRKQGKDQTFWENRTLYIKLCNIFPDCVQPVKLKGVYGTKLEGDEGAVGIPKDGNLWGGYKLKWSSDPIDLTIKSIEFKYSPTSTKNKIKIAGKITGVDDKTNKEYKIGPGSFGTHNECIKVMKEPKKYIGRVMIVKGLRGHPGRSLKFIGFHPDK